MVLVQPAARVLGRLDHCGLSSFVLVCAFHFGPRLLCPLCSEDTHWSVRKWTFQIIGNCHRTPSLYLTVILRFHSLNLNNLLLHCALLISCYSTVGCRNRLYNSKFNLTIIQNQGGRDYHRPPYPQILNWIFTLVITQLRIKKDLCILSELPSQVSQSLRTQRDIGNRLPCGGVDAKQTQTWRPDITIPNFLKV